MPHEVRDRVRLLIDSTLNAFSPQVHPSFFQMNRAGEMSPVLHSFRTGKMCPTLHRFVILAPATCCSCCAPPFQQSARKFGTPVIQQLLLCCCVG